MPVGDNLRATFSEAAVFLETVVTKSVDLLILAMNAVMSVRSENERSNAESRWESEGGNHWQHYLFIPLLASTEEALAWGSHLNSEQHATLVKTQRELGDRALAEHDLQHMVDLATQSQLMREAAEAFRPRTAGRRKESLSVGSS